MPIKLADKPLWAFALLADLKIRHEKAISTEEQSELIDILVSSKRGDLQEEAVRHGFTLPEPEQRRLIAAAVANADAHVASQIMYVDYMYQLLTIRERIALLRILRNTDEADCGYSLLEQRHIKNVDKRVIVRGVVRRNSRVLATRLLRKYAYRNACTADEIKALEKIAKGW